MTRTPRTLLLPLAAALVASAVIAAPSAQAKSFTIVAGKWAVKRIGPFKTQNTQHYHPTVGRAIRAFGQPSSRFQKQGGCVVKWKRLGLRIEFWNFGGMPPGRTICSDEVGLAQSFNITGRKFRTWRGLRVGMRESRVTRLHPAAEWFDGDRYSPAAWWLRRQTSPFGDNSDYAIVAARVRRDRVSQLDGWIGAAGE